MGKDKIVVDAKYLRDRSKELTDVLSTARQFVTRQPELMSAADAAGNLSVRQQMQNVFAETGKAMVGLVALGESITVTLLFTAQLYEDADAAVAAQYAPELRPPLAPPQTGPGSVPPPFDMNKPLG